MKTRILVLSGAILLAALPGWADWTFTSGTTTSGGETVAGTAVFHIVNSSEIDLTMTNLSNIIDIGTVLDGLAFTVTGTNSLSLTNVTASAGGLNGGSGDFVDCTSGTCTSVSTFHDYQAGVDRTSPYSWTLTGSYLNSAGSGSYKPAGIVNSSINGSLDGLSNPQHNDYLFGPVTFKFTDSDNTSMISNISGVTFYWGTNPDTTAGTGGGGGGGGGGQVPEPTSILLLAPVAAWALYRRRQNQQNV